MQVEFKPYKELGNRTKSQEKIPGMRLPKPPPFCAFSQPREKRDMPDERIPSWTEKPETAAYGAMILLLSPETWERYTYSPFLKTLTSGRWKISLHWASDTPPTNEILERIDNAKGGGVLPLKQPKIWKMRPVIRYICKTVTPTR